MLKRSDISSLTKEIRKKRNFSTHAKINYNGPGGVTPDFLPAWGQEALWA